MNEKKPLSIDIKPTTSIVSDEDWYGKHQWQCGYERGWDKAKEAEEELIAELERENNMLRARNERLEKENTWLEAALANAQIQLLNKNNQNNH